MKVPRPPLATLDSVPNLYSAKSFNVSHVPGESFVNWFGAKNENLDPDKFRNWLYYGFQPLFDQMVSGDLTPIQRKSALAIFTVLNEISKDYLTQYYTLPKVDVERFSKSFEVIDAEIKNLEGVDYYKKFRNVDSNQIYPPMIQSFLRDFGNLVQKEVIPRPDFVVGCACGSSEIAFPLAGLLGTECFFIRASKRRYDSVPLVLKEEDDLLEEKFKGAVVVCVEDFICTGGSMNKVLKKVWDYKPKTTFAVCISDSHEGPYVQRIGKFGDNLHFSTLEGKCRTLKSKLQKLSIPETDQSLVL